MPIVDDGHITVASKKRKSFSTLICPEALVTISYYAGFLMKLFDSYKYERTTLAEQIQKRITENNDFNVSEIHNAIVATETGKRILHGDIMVTVQLKEEDIKEASIKNLAEQIRSDVEWGFSGWILACIIIETGTGKKFFF